MQTWEWSKEYFWYFTIYTYSKCCSKWPKQMHTNVYRAQIPFSISGPGYPLHCCWRHNTRESWHCQAVKLFSYQMILAGVLMLSTLWKRSKAGCVVWTYWEEPKKRAKDIIAIFCSKIEYAAEVWHPGLIMGQAEAIWVIQKRASALPCLVWTMTVP